VEYDRFKSAYAWCWGVGACLDHKRAARHWQGFRDRTEPYVAIAESHNKASGTTIDTEVDRTTRHLEWAKMEKRWADSMERIVREEYRTGNYIDEAVRTVNTANAEVIWAEKSIKTVRKELNSLLDGTLNKVRQAKYDKADDYLSQQRVIHEAEQAEIERAAREKEQAITDKENGFLQVIKLLLYITRQGG
jgi:hypothetical protein